MWTFASRLTGFGRVVLIGAILGPTYFGNLFQLANQLPWIVFELAIGSLLYALLVPALVASVADGDRERIERVAGGFLGLVALGFTVLAVVVAVAAPVIARLFAVPLSSDGPEVDFLRAAAPLVVLTAPQLVGYGVAMTGQAVQQAMGRFALPAAAAIVENVVLIGALAIFAIRYGVGLSLTEIGGEHLLLLGGGATLGVFLHAAIQLWGVRRLGIRLRPRAGWSDPEISAILRAAVPSSGTAVLSSARLLLLLVAANVVPGGVVAFQLALNVLNLPVALGAKPVAYASLPRLSLLHQRGDREGASRAYAQSVGLAGLLLIPAAVAAVTLGRFASAGLALGQMGNDDGRRLVALCLIGIGGAVVGEGLFQVSTATSYALDDPTGPLRALAIRLAVTAAGMAATGLLLDGPIMLLAFALAMSAGDLVGSLLLHRRIAGLLSVRWPVVTPLGRSALGAGVAFGLAGLLAEILDRNGLTPTRPPMALAATAAIGVAAIALFALLAHRLDPQVATLVADLRTGRGETGPPAVGRVAAVDGPDTAVRPPDDGGPVGPPGLVS